MPTQETLEMKVRSLGQEDPLEEGMATHASILAWKIPWGEEPGRQQSIVLHKVGHDWSDLACMHIASKVSGLKQLLIGHTGVGQKFKMDLEIHL